MTAHSFPSAALAPLTTKGAEMNLRVATLRVYHRVQLWPLCCTVTGKTMGRYSFQGQVRIQLFPKTRVSPKLGIV